MPTVLIPLEVMSVPVYLDILVMAFFVVVSTKSQFQLYNGCTKILTKAFFFQMLMNVLMEMTHVIATPTVLTSLEAITVTVFLGLLEMVSVAPVSILQQFNFIH